MPSTCLKKIFSPGRCLGGGTDSSPANSADNNPNNSPCRCRGGSADSGFTLIELIVALALMAVLFSVAIPPLMEYRVSIYERERQANMSAINDAIRQCYALEGRYPPAVGETGLDYLRENYQIIVKENVYEYGYSVVNGGPVLSVELRGR